MKLGDWDNAEKYLAQYKATKGVPNAVVNAENLGLQGDVKVQKGDYKKAAALFEQAAAVADNNFTTPLYLKKAALAYEAAGDTAAALKTYKRIATEYAASVEARDAEKMLGQE
jgi:tetratricopeptide (TPR) repeat protein